MSISEHARTPQGVTYNATQKALKYRNQQYSISQAPPVPTSNWSERDWIRYIDQNGHWHA